MSNIENRIVSMTFDNENFENKLAATLSSLDKLTESLNFAGAQNGFSELSRSADEFDLSGMQSGIERISHAFSLMGAIGFSVIQKLTQGAVSFALELGRTLLDPLLAGGKERATNIENAKFQFRGLGLDVEAAMESARKAVTGTAFGLDVAAKAAAQFGASGIEAGDEMTQALRGIAGAAAMTNTGFSEIADIFTSAAAYGKVTNLDLNRFSTRGLNAAAALAKQLNITEAEVKDMATNGELSFDVFSKAMDDAFGEHATRANETYQGSLANLRAAMSRLGASFFGPSLTQQRDLFNAMSPAIDKAHEALKPLIATFVDLKGIGIQKLIGFINNLDFTSLTKAVPNFSDGLRSAFTAVGQVITVVKEAFRDIFPPSTTSTLLSISEAFKAFAQSLLIGGENLDRLKSIFRGFFSSISIGFEIVKGVANLFRDLLSSLGDSSGIDSGGILEFLSNIGESLVNLKTALVDGGGIAEFFEKLGEVIKNPALALELLKEAVENIKESFLALFNGGEIPGAEGVSAVVGRVGQRMEMLQSLAQKVGDAWSYLSDRFSGFGQVLEQVWEYISTWFSELGSKLAAVMNPGDFDAAVDTVNVGLLGGIALILKNFLDGGIDLNFFGGITEKITEALDGLTGVLKGMQIDLKAKALIKIALAIALLTASVVVLSLIDSVALTKALIAMSVGFGQLVGTMTLMTKFATPKQAASLGLVAGAMILLAGAAILLSVAVKNLSSLGWEELAKGLIGIGVALGILVIATNNITANTAGLIKAGFAMIGISLALLILSTAVKQFAELSWDELAKGLIGIGVGLGILVIGMNAMPTSGMIQAGAGLILMSVGLRILAEAVSAFSGMGWAEMTKGMVGIGAALLIVAGAMHLMPDNMISTAAGLVLVSIALNGIALAVRTMGGMDMGQLAKGIGGIAATMLILAIAMNAMNGTAAGAAAMLVAAGALVVLSQVIKELGSLSLTELALGIGAIAAVLAVLGIGAALLTPVIPTLLGLGAALILVGAGFALFGIGASLVAKAFEALGKSAKAGSIAIVEGLEVILAALPKIVTAMARSLLNVVNEFLKGVPTLIKALAVIVGHLLETIIELAPKIAEAFGAIVIAGLEIIRTLAPQFIETGLLLIQSLLQGISGHIEEIVVAAVGIITQFALTLAESAPQLVDSALVLLFAFLGAIAERIDEIIAAGVNLVVNFLLGISNSLDIILLAATTLIINFIQGIALAAYQVVAAGLQILTSLLLGISQNMLLVINTVTALILQFITTMGENALLIIDAGFTVLKNLLQGIADNMIEVANTVGDIIAAFITAMSDNSQKIITAGVDAIIDFIQGIEDSMSDIVTAGVDAVLAFLDGVADNAVRLAEGASDIIVDFVDGLATAIEDNQDEMERAGRRLALAIVDGATFGLASKAADLARKAKDVFSNALGSVGNFLGISSPSKKFIQIGKYMAEGVVVALDGDKTVGRSAVSLAQRTTKAFEKTLSRVSTALVGMDAFSPVITPVLDLTKVQAASRNMDSLLGVSKIRPDVSFDNARYISATSQPARPEDTIVNPASSEIKFEQNIYSPQALSANDIYRSTKSQIALAKEELKV